MSSAPDQEEDPWVFHYTAALQTFKYPTEAPIHAFDERKKMGERHLAWHQCQRRAGLIKLGTVTLAYLGASATQSVRTANRGREERVVNVHVYISIAPGHGRPQLPTHYQPSRIASEVKTPAY